MAVVIQALAAKLKHARVLQSLPPHDLNDDVMPTRLTAATEDGGLFASRFG